jgi:hypothetical protein
MVAGLGCDISHCTRPVSIKARVVNGFGSATDRDAARISTNAWMLLLRLTVTFWEG